MTTGALEGNARACREHLVGEVLIVSAVGSAEKVNQHYVCTHAQARDLISKQHEFYIAICGCRQRQGGCSRSRMDVCLMFNPEFSTGTEKRTAARQDAMDIVAEADAKGLVSRPFRNMKKPEELDGICFCCPECCYYFQHPEEPCDKGILREHTTAEDCSACGLCVEACHFGARQVVDGKLIVDSGKCYGCGLCVDACPAGCIEMK
jgi:ferredoxin